MEYERIHKVQTGIISPSKLRMRLIGCNNQKKKDGSNSNSARTSPSKLADSDFVKNSLLASEFEEEVSTAIEVKPVKNPNHSDPIPNQQKEQSVGRVKIQHPAKVDTGNSSTIYPLRIMEDENLDYDSTSSFEFHKGDRGGHNRSSLSQSRSIPSKWNDAEKWIMSKNNQFPKKNALQNQTNRLPVANTVKVAPEYTNYSYDYNSNKLGFNRGLVDAKRVDFSQPFPQVGFVGSGQGCGSRAHPQTRDLKELVIPDLPCRKNEADDLAGVSRVREVCMRDMGTEMTPIPSQEPSRTATPVGSTTPHRSPASSMPSTPRREDPSPTPLDDELNGFSKKELTEEDLKLKTRREIVALGVKLGKMNIAAWASKQEAAKNKCEELERVENEKRADAWEEVEKSKHTARYKREEIEIQAWESQQRLKLEAEMRRIEAQVEKMRALAQAKMVKKMTMTRKRSEEKRAAAEARKNREAERTAAQTEYIRQTGKLPSSRYMCCSWL